MNPAKEENRKKEKENRGEKGWYRAPEGTGRKGGGGGGGRQVVEQDMGRTRLVARNEVWLRSETGETGRGTLKKASSPNLGNNDLGREVSVRQLEQMLSKDCKECVASGRLDGFFHNKINLWDVAAGTIMVKEACGLVNNLSEFAINNIDIKASSATISEKMLENLKNF